MKIREIITESISVTDWIEKIYSQFPVWPLNQNQRVIDLGGEGENQQFVWFELKPSTSKRNAVDIDWIGAHPQRSGAGTKGLKILQGLANEAGISLTLFPWEHGPVSQPKLIKFYKKSGFVPQMKGSKHMKWDPQPIEEGWKEWVAGGALAAGALAGAYNHYNQPPEFKQPARPITMSPVLKYKLISNNPSNEDDLRSAADKANITGYELAQLMAQCAHETKNFVSTTEDGTDKNFTKWYENKADLGNTEPGDGIKYKGRGFIHLTGRYNYTEASKALGLDLVNNPELAAEPKNAAKIAIWYWKFRVDNRVTDFTNTTKVTRAVNGKINGLDERIRYFNLYVKTLGLQSVEKAAGNVLPQVKTKVKNI